MPGHPFTYATSQVERVRDWNSLDRQEDVRVNLSGRVENVTGPLLGGLPFWPYAGGNAAVDRLHETHYNYVNIWS